MKLINLLRNLLALIGVAALAAGGFAYSKVNTFMDRLDPGAVEMYTQLSSRYMEDLDPGAAVVKSVKVQDGLTADDVVESLKSLAVQHNLLFVGEAPFYKQVEAVTGQPYRFVAFYSFCDARVGAEMLEYNTAYTAFMPCRISLVEDNDGGLWLHMMNLDTFIHGGKPLPENVKEGALRVRDSLNKILAGAAIGEF